MLSRKGSVTLAIFVLVCAALSCRRSGSVPGNAFVERDGGTAEVVAGRRRGVLPAGDLAGDEPVTFVQDESGRRLAYRTSSGMARILYAVGDGFFAGPLVPHPPDFRAVPDLDHALGPLFETAGPRQRELVREMREEHGEQGVVRLLLAAAYVDSLVWEMAFEDLSPASQALVREGLVSGLEPGKPTVLLRRAVNLGDVRAPERAKTVAARARELASGAEEPRAAAILLRAVIANDLLEAAAIGCEVLAKRPPSPPEGYALLREAALLAIAASGADCPDPKLLEAALESPCHHVLLCRGDQPVSSDPLSSDGSDLSEPLCTREQLAKVIARELERNASDPSALGRGYADLFAFAALLAKDRVPASFYAGHARRSYAIQQPRTPACNWRGVSAGTPCWCDEYDLRHAACANPGSTRLSTGSCRFQVDDATKRIFGVVAE